MRHSCTKSLSPFLACTVVLHAVFSRTFDSIKHCWAFVLTSKGPHTMLSCIFCVCVCVWSGWKDSLCHVELANTESRGEKLHNSSAVWSQPPRGITTTFPQNTPLVWACLQPCSQYCTHRHKRCKKTKKNKERQTDGTQWIRPSDAGLFPPHAFFYFSDVVLNSHQTNPATSCG